MKFIRFQKNGSAQWGLVEGDDVFAVEGSIYENFQKGSTIGRMADMKLLPPCEPTKIVGVALNYQGVVKTIDPSYEPLFFIKGTNALADAQSPIHFHPTMDGMWIEAELAFVVKKTAKNVPVEKAAGYILGYTLANDVTALNVLKRDWHLARSKSADTFCPTGPWLLTGIDPQNVRLESRVNGVVAQSESTKARIFNDAQCLSLISRYLTLYPGDIILTGTPLGTGIGARGEVKPGDEVVISADGFGQLTNKVVAHG